jgi:hypothetical protein
MTGKRTETPTSGPLKVYARMRFMRLDKPKPFDEGGDPRWEATGILDPTDPKGAEGIKLLLTTAAKLAKETYGVTPLAIKKLAAKFIPGTKPVDLNDPANADDGIKIAFVDGDADKWKGYAGYQGMFIVPSHNAKMKPGVANRRGVTVQPGEPQYPYDGCYAIYAVSLWIQVGKTEQKYGRRVGINLRGVQFAADGQGFSQDTITAEDEFQALEDAPATAADENAFD